MQKSCPLPLQDFPRAGLVSGWGEVLVLPPKPSQSLCDFKASWDLSRIPNCSNLGHRDSWALPRAGRATQPLSSGTEHLLIRNCTFHRENEEKQVEFFTLSHWIFKLKIPQFSRRPKRKKNYETGHKQILIKVFPQDFLSMKTFL